MITQAKFIGELYVIDTESCDERVDDKAIVLEVLEVCKDGSVTISFEDDNETMYVSFAMRDFIDAVFTARGVEP